MNAGVFGEMMLAYFKGKGGAGIVIDGCIRDFPHARHLGLPMWVRGLTPNFHTQVDLMPFAVNVPVACGGVLVMPGDIIVADDDGAVCVPAVAAEELVQKGSIWQEWDDFTRERLLAVLRQMPRVEIIEVTADYVHAQATTRWMRYVDDLEFRLRGQTIELRSSSRIGYYDFEVNRQRLEDIRRRFTDHGAPP